MGITFGSEGDGDESSYNISKRQKQARDGGAGWKNFTANVWFLLTTTRSSMISSCPSHPKIPENASLAY
jgi:hypothetical protein